jgi:hypothetical protein
MDPKHRGLNNRPPEKPDKQPGNKEVRLNDRIRFNENEPKYKGHTASSQPPLRKPSSK